VSLRIGMLCHVGVGGSARVAMELGGALAGRGHDIHVFARRAPLGLAHPPEGVALHTLDDGRCHRATAELDSKWTPVEIEELVQRVISVARGANLDVLHFHYALPFAWVTEAVRSRLGTAAPALVGTLHGTDVSILGRRAGPQRGLAAVLPWLDGLTTVSDSHAELAAETFQLTNKPEVIPNFVDLQRFRPGPASTGERQPRVVHVSNFRSAKQPLAVARIFRKVRRRADAALWLVGDGEGMPRVRESLASAGLTSSTRHFGLRLDVESILPYADVMLVTSKTESFCMVALEAAACGLPVVAPRVGGLPVTVLDGHTGRLFAPGDETTAADAIVTLLEDAGLRERMSAEALWHARQFSSDVVVPRYEELYRRVIDQRSARGGVQVSPAA